MERLHIDLETFSVLLIGGSKGVGAFRYVDDPSFEVLLFGYKVDDAPTVCIDLTAGEVIPPEILEALRDPSVVKVAFNAAFERHCLHKYLGQYMPPEQWEDTMILAANCGLPLKLELCCEALHLPQDKAKLNIGRTLIRKFCCPVKPTKKWGMVTRITPDMDPENWALFKTYNIRDVDAEAEIDRMLQHWRPDAVEHRFWCLDARINELGMRVDRQMVRNAMEMDARYKEELAEKAIAVSGIENPNSVSQIKQWLSEQEDIEVPSLNKKEVADVVARLQTDATREFMAIRAELSKTSTKKYAAYLRCSTDADPRVRGCFQFFGGHTGRFAGRLVQLQNLPSNNMPDLDEARQLVLADDYETMRCLYPSVTNVLSELLRTALVADYGTQFVVCDFSAIEARVSAWFAGEEAVLEEFRGEGLMSDDVKRVKDGWTKGRDAKSIYPREHQNNKEMNTGPNAGQRALGTLGAFNEATEAMTRFAEYLATIERFGDTYENRLQGIKNAAEVTVDFGRHGSVGKVLNAWIPYWNPAMQGMSRLIRSVAEGDQGHFDARKALGTVGRAGMMVVLPQALIMAAIMAAGRKDEWEQFDDRTKDTYYLIPLADHQWLKVPKNREWGAILGAPLMRMWEAANGRDDAFETYLETSIIPNFLPGGPLDIVGLSQTVDLLTNEDFAGRSIVPYSLAQGSRGEQWDGDTSLVSKWFADLWNAAAGNALTEALGTELTASPMEVDYLLGDYFGDFADIFRQWSSVNTWSGDDPVRSMTEALASTVTTPWIANELRSNQAVGDYYDLLDRLAKEVQDASTEDSRNGTELKAQSTAYQAQKAIQKLYGDRITELYGLVNSTPDEAEQNEYRSEIVTLAGEALRYYEDIQSGKIQHPILEANYADLPGDVSDELIRLDGMTEEYSFLPITSASKTYTVPGQKYHQYELTDEQRQQFKDLYMEVYGQTMSSQIQSAAYQQASDAAKAEMLEVTRDTVLERTKEQFFLELEAQGVSAVQKELPMELPVAVANELYRLDSYTAEYSFAPTGSASDTFADPRRSDKEYVLTAEQKLQYKAIYREVYGELMAELMAKSRYKSAKDAKKAALLEEERDKVLEETKDRFYDWLRDTGAEPVEKE